MILAGFLLAGCRFGVKTVPVSGRVTMDGTGVKNVGVTFTPVGSETTRLPGPGSWGVTDAKGQYSLKTVGEPSARGAVVGTHRVTLAYHDPNVDENAPVMDVKQIRQIFPVKTRDGTMTLVVPAGGTSEANFDFTSQEMPK